MADTMQKRVSEMFDLDPPDCACAPCAVQFQIVQKFVEALDGLSLPDADVQKIRKGAGRGLQHLPADQVHAAVLVTLAAHAFISSVLQSELIHPRALANMLNNCFMEIVGAGDGPDVAPTPAGKLH